MDGLEFLKTQYPDLDENDKTGTINGNLWVGIAALLDGFAKVKNKELENRYIDAHCNPDFEGDKMQYIFGDNSNLKDPPMIKQSVII